MSAWATVGQFVVFFATLAAAVYAVAKLTDAACHWAAGWKARAETKRSDLAHAQSNAEHFRTCWEAASKDRDRNAHEAALMTQAYSRADTALCEMTAKRDAARGEARRWKALAKAQSAPRSGR